MEAIARSRREPACVSAARATSDERAQAQAMRDILSPSSDATILIDSLAASALIFAEHSGRSSSSRRVCSLSSALIVATAEHPRRNLRAMRDPQDREGDPLPVRFGRTSSIDRSTLSWASLPRAVSAVSRSGETMAIRSLTGCPFGDVRMGSRQSQTLIGRGRKEPKGMPAPRRSRWPPPGEFREAASDRSPSCLGPAPSGPRRDR
jgi:hypothetical protein